MTPQFINICGVSGGKDSIATMLWMIYKSGYDPESLMFIFNDTQWEHPWTYRHLAWIHDNIHPIIWLRGERGFADLVKHKKRFPDPFRRFCTDWLKIRPTHEFQLWWLANGYQLVSHNGIRSGEKSSGPNDRSLMTEWGEDVVGATLRPKFAGYPIKVRRPLITWTIADVIGIHLEYNVPLNPLYALGFRRVGCMPCIMANKKELRTISEQFPERYEYLAQLERDVNSNREAQDGAHQTYASFFQANAVPPRFRSLSIQKVIGKEADGSKKVTPLRTLNVPTVDDVRQWSLTGKGALPEQPVFDFGDIAQETLLQQAARLMLSKDIGALEAMLADDNLSMGACPKGYCE